MSVDPDRLEEVADVAVRQLRDHVERYVERHAVAVERQVASQLELLRQRIAELEARVALLARE